MTFSQARHREVEQGHRSRKRHLGKNHSVVAQATRAGQRLLTGCWLYGHLGTVARVSPAPAGTPQRSPRRDPRGPGRRHRSGNAAPAPSPASPPSASSSAHCSPTLRSSPRCLAPPPTQGPMRRSPTPHVRAVPVANGRTRRRAKGRSAAR